MMTLEQRKKQVELAKLLERRNKKKERDTLAYCILLAVICVLLVLMVYLTVLCDRAEKEREAAAANADKPVPVQLFALREEEDPDEDAKIEEALLASGYFRADVPLPFAEQDYLHTAAEEAGIPYELALAVVRVETGFRNVLGDDGESAGYMQVQERWHSARMEKLGVTDLMDPAGNFRVGCNYLAELVVRYGDLTDALTAYNSGRPGDSDYAAEVLAAMEELSE